MHYEGAIRGARHSYDVVSEMYTNQITIFNPASCEIIGSVTLPEDASSEQMVVIGDKLYVAWWSYGNKVYEIDTKTDKVVGEIEVTAFAGHLTVSVETVGRWIVNEADNASWISFDVQGGVGKGAFTVSYEANMSSVVDMKSSRKARVVVTSEDYAKSDTLNIIQQGFYSDIVPSVVTPSAEIILEYVETPSRTLSVVYLIWTP